MNGRRFSYEEMDEIYAKNEAIVESLSRSLTQISRQLSAIVSGTDSSFEPHTIYQLMRTVLENALDGTAYILPEDLAGYKELLEEEAQHIDIIDELEVDGISSKQRAELNYSLKQYLKDFLYGIQTIVESNPGMETSELCEDVDVMTEGLREMLLLRAGLIPEDFKDDRLI